MSASPVPTRRATGVGPGRHASRRRAFGVVAVALLATMVVTDVIPARHADAAVIEENHSISYGGQDGSAVYTPANSTVAVLQSDEVTRESIRISVVEKDGPWDLAFEFASRDSSHEKLTVGYYGDTQIGPFTDPGRPGMSMGPIGFCSDQRGNFEVRDIQRSGPTITRIWITFQRYCNNALSVDQRPTFGEIRLGYPKPASVDVTPRAVRWPPGPDPGQSSYDVPVTVFPTGSTPVTVSSVAVTGPTPSSFPIRRNGCTGVVGPSGCTVVVGFVPPAGGPRYARLEVKTSAGTLTTTLDGAGNLGVSDWSVDVDHDEPTYPDLHIDVPHSLSWGNPYELASQGWDADGSLWNTQYYPPRGEKFAQGGHYEYKPDGLGPLVSLAQGNNACEITRATLDIAKLAYQGVDDRLSLLDATFSTYCREARGHTVRGRIRHHARTDLKGPFRVSEVSAVRDGGYVNLSWTNPPSTDFARTIVRWYSGDVAPGAPDVGNLARYGTTSPVRFAAPTGQPVAIAIWTFDKTGNAGLRTSLVVP
ncbi:hypothetical protein ACFY3U_02925 [Micromonospora sp. NPDC000089]|uniref:hypothetical protein n=1 Tax=unclassified Micromonospora TaxID=2617518 RepID=UPI0036A33B2B